LWLNSQGYLYFSSTPVARVGVGELTLSTPNGSIQAGQWYHFAAVISTSGNHMRIYVNGRLLAERAYDASGIRDTGGPLRIGQAPGWDNYFKGRIDEISIWNTAQSAADIQAGMYRRPAGTESDLLAYWPLDAGGATTPDASGHGNTGYLGSSSANRPLWTADPALQFDGSNDYAQAGDAAPLRPASALTLEAWVSPGANFASGTRHIVSKTVGGSSRDSYAIWYSGGQLRAVAGNASGGTTQLNYNWSPTQDAWYHIAFSYDASGPKLYIDGVLVASNSSTATLGYDSHPVVIGDAYSFENLGQPWSGRIRDLRLWNVARSQSDIQAGMNAVPTRAEAGLAALWRLDEGSGIVAHDATANHNNASLGVAIALRPLWDSGPSLNFDGVNDFVDMGNPIANPLDLGVDATLETWVRFNALPVNSMATLASKDLGGGSQNKWIFAYANNFGGVAGATVLHINNPQNGGSVFLSSDPWTPTAGTWYHLAVTKSGNNYSFYRDGVLVGTASTAVVMPDVAANFVVGRAENNFPLNGQMRDLRLWSAARSAAEILANKDVTL
ncbi:MAG: LamG domain-containing protein, partial [Rhodocyclaceae bacterium]|nr:LamG domain-containing protein [Rhodocyclaceae bacterium]